MKQNPKTKNLDNKHNTTQSNTSIPNTPFNRRYSKHTQYQTPPLIGDTLNTQYQTPKQKIQQPPSITTKKHAQSQTKTQRCTSVKTKIRKKKSNNMNDKLVNNEGTAADRRRQ